MIRKGSVFQYPQENLRKQVKFAQGGYTITVFVRKRGAERLMVNAWPGGRDQRQTGKIVQERTINGILSSVTVQFYDRSGNTVRKVTFAPGNRIASHKKTVEYLPVNAGFYPEVTIGLIGGVAVGKTTLLNAVRAHSTVNRLERWKVFSAQTDLDQKKDAQPNPASDISSTALYIKRFGKVLCYVRLIDIGGELTAGKYAVDTERAGEVDDLYRDCDAYLLMTDLREARVDGDLDFSRRTSRHIAGNWRNMLARLEADIYRKPKAFVVTGLDVLQTQLTRRYLQCCSDGKLCFTRSSPLFDLEGEKPLAKRLALHTTLARYFFANFIDGDAVSYEDNMKNYFFVSSGRPAGQVDPEDSPMMDFTKTNVELPILWLLNQLGLVALG